MTPLTEVERALELWKVGKGRSFEKFLFVFRNNTPAPELPRSGTRRSHDANGQFQPEYKWEEFKLAISRWPGGMNDLAEQCRQMWGMSRSTFYNYYRAYREGRPRIPEPQITMNDDEVISLALKELQSALAKKFGANSDSDSGQCTIYISPSAVSLTNDKGTVIAWSAEDAAREILS